MLLQADGDVTVLSTSKVNSSANASVDSRGFGTGATANIPIKIGKPTNLAKTLTNVGSGVSLVGRNVSVDALVDGMTVKSYADAQADAFGTSTEATAETLVNNQVNVVLAGSSALAAKQTVNVRARTTGVSLISKTNSDADAAFGSADATSTVNYVSQANVLAQDGSTITAGSLNVDASQGIVDYQRLARADFAGIGSQDANRKGLLLANRGITFDADVSLLSTAAGTPKLLVAADGKIMTADSITVNGGKRAGDILAAGSVVSVDPIINGNNLSGQANLTVNSLSPNGRIDADAVFIPQGTIAGSTGSFNGPTAFSKIEIENQFNGPLVINDISSVSYTANPDVRVNGQNVSLQFDIGTAVPALTDIVIQQTGSTQDVRIAGLVDNPLGTTTISSTRGNIVDIGAGLLRAGQIKVDAQTGSIGTDANPLNIELVRSNVGQGAVLFNAGTDIDVQLDGRLRDTNLDAVFAGRSITAGGDVDIMLSTVRKQVDPLGTAQVGVDVGVNGASLVTYGTRYSSAQATSNIARDPRVYPDPAKDTFVDATFRFDQITANNITVISTNRAANQPRNSIIAGTDVRYDSSLNDRDGDIRVLTGGSITLTEKGELPIDEIASSAGNVTLTAVGFGADIFDVAANNPAVAYLRGNHISLTAGGAIGTPTDVLEIDSAVQAAGSLTASAVGFLGIREVVGDMNLVTVVSNLSDVLLDAQAGSILESGDDAQADIQGRNLQLSSSIGSIGSLLNPIEIFGAGTSQSENEFQITAAQPTAGRLIATAAGDISLFEVNADIDILKVVSTNGNVSLAVRDTVLTAGFFDGPNSEDIQLRNVSGTDLTGVSIVQPSIFALGSVTLSAGDRMRIEEGAKITAGSTISMNVDASSDNPDPGVGATISIAGSVKGSSINIAGGADIDFIEILGSDIDSNNVRVYGESPTLPADATFGDDRIFIQAVKFGSNFIVDGGRGADQYFVSSTASIARLTQNGAYDDTTGVLARLNGSLETVAGSLTIATGASGNGGTRDAIYLSSGAASSGLVGKLADDTVTGLGMAGSVKFSSTEGASIWLGLSSFNDTLQVASLTAPFAALIYAGAGNDTLNAYNNVNSLSGLSGVVVFEGDAGNDTLNVRGNGTSQSPGLLTAISVSGLEMGNNSLYSLQTELGYPLDPSSATNGTAPAAIYFGSRSGFEEDYRSTVESVNIQLGSGDDLLQVDSASSYGTRSVLGGDGNDRIVFGSSPNGLFPNSADRVDTINGFVSVDLQAGTADQIVINDSGDADANVGHLSGTTVSGLGMSSTVNAIGAENVSVLLGAQGDTFYINATDAGRTYTVNLGGGFDTAYVGTRSGLENQGSLDLMQGPLTILGEGPESGDQLFVNDQDSTISRGYTISNEVTGVLNVIAGDDLPLDTTTVQREGIAAIRYQRVETVALNTGSAADSIHIYATHREVDPLGGKSATFTVNAGAGDDTISLGQPTANGFTLDPFRIQTGALTKAIYRAASLSS
ncbi:MAG: hypothetical protein U0892_18550 [Pirellulales bacterium]